MNQPTQTQDTTPCADLEHHPRRDRLSATVVERLLALVSSPALLRACGAAVPLLAELILRCDETETTVINLHAIARQLSVSHSTVKGWLHQLEKHQFVDKRALGARGVSIQLRLDRIPVAPGYEDMRHKLDEADGILRGLRAIVSTVVDGGLAKLSA